MRSIMRLHLQYRLWISDLNADINTLRIFDDYLNELKEKNLKADLLKQLKSYNEQFTGIRKELDELRHEMHLTKMKLGALSKTNEAEKNIEKAINYKADKEKYKDFRKRFSRLTKEFKKMEV
ncbi:MAG: hypothetical protein JO072_04595 [Parafilimonas sp.]|nr:hypothetical protein [Parafilimonas sp.]